MIPVAARGERGIALVITLLVLLVVALMAASLMANVLVSRQVTGLDVRSTAALNEAEAGVGEAIARIRNGDADLDPANPRAVAQIFLTSPGSVPVLGADSTALATAQPAGAWMNYTTSTKSADALTVKFKTNAARTVIRRYDTSLNPPENSVSGYPIYVVTSTGRKGNARTTVQAEVIKRPMPVTARAALAAGNPIQFVGNAVVCGHNHSASTAAWDGENGRVGAPANKYCQDNELGSGDLPGAWSTGTINSGGTSDLYGTPAASANQTGFYQGPWEMMGIGQADFFTLMGTPRTSITSLNGLNYVDDDNVPQNRSQNLGVHGGTGEGLLYVDGDLTMNSTTVFRGLLYVEGDLKLNGQAWILGGVVVRGKTTVKMNGGATILYSADAISQALSRSAGQFVTLSWREVR